MTFEEFEISARKEADRILSESSGSASSHEAYGFWRGAIWARKEMDHKIQDYRSHLSGSLQNLKSLFYFCDHPDMRLNPEFEVEVRYCMEKAQEFLNSTKEK